MLNWSATHVNDFAVFFQLLVLLYRTVHAMFVFFFIVRIFTNCDIGRASIQLLFINSCNCSTDVVCLALFLTLIAC